MSGGKGHGVCNEDCDFDDDQVSPIPLMQMICSGEPSLRK
jgi:hypothetical protein